MNLAYRYPLIFWNTANLIIDSGATFEIYNEDDEEEDFEYTLFDEDEDDDDKSSEASKINYGKIAKAIGDMQQNGVVVLPPDINKSNLTFVPNVEQNTVIYGLKGISYVGDELVDNIINNRPYSGLTDFMKKVKANKRSMANLIKAGAFDEFNDRKKIMEEYINIISETKNRLTLQNANMLIQRGLIPSELEFEQKVFNFNKYIKKFKQKDTNNFIIDSIAYPFYEKNFDMDLLSPLDNETYTIDKTKWKVKIYDVHMAKIRKYIKDNEAELLEKLNESLTQDMRDKYAQGSLAQWSMDSVSFYQDEHELSNVDYLGNNISKFYSLPEDPVIERSFKTKDGHEINMFELHKIAGTAIDRNKDKSEITLLCVDGVVNVKAYGVMPYYNKQLSKINPDGTKTVVEKSMFHRGSKVIAYGMRRGDTFYAKKYKNSPVAHTFTRIIKVNDDGTLVTQERVVEDE